MTIVIRFIIVCLGVGIVQAYRKTLRKSRCMPAPQTTRAVPLQSQEELLERIKDFLLQSVRDNPAEDMKIVEIRRDDSVCLAVMRKGSRGFFFLDDFKFIGFPLCRVKVFLSPAFGDNDVNVFYNVGNTPDRYSSNTWNMSQALSVCRDLVTGQSLTRS